MKVSDVDAAVSGELGFGKYTGGDLRPSREEIARLAYQFYTARGQDGHDVDDWLSAEQELKHHYQ